MHDTGQHQESTGIEQVKRIYNPFGSTPLVDTLVEKYGRCFTIQTLKQIGTHCPDEDTVRDRKSWTIRDHGFFRLIKLYREQSGSPTEDECYHYPRLKNEKARLRAAIEELAGEKGCCEETIRRYYRDKYSDHYEDPKRPFLQDLCALDEKLDDCTDSG